MPDIESMISAQRIICIKRYLSTDRAAWNLGGKFLFHYNFNDTKLPIALPDFYKECIVTWTSLYEDNPSTLSEIANQIIWNIQFICINSKSIYNDRLIDLEIVKIGDPFGTRGEFKKDLKQLYSTLSPVQHFFLFSLFSANPKMGEKL